MAVRIAGVNIPEQKHTWVALSSSIYGIGKTTAYKICAAANVPAEQKIADLSEDELERIRVQVAAIPEHGVEGDLRRAVSMNIKQKIDKRSYEGTRHRRGLPLNGQRTKTNARTRKGKRKPVRQ